jgi:2,3-diketo-5-methylthio-1-phosphopentane phosphatase
MVRVFIDFDGTITRRDVGDLMFETFGGPACTAIVAEYRDEKISAVECFRKECEACGVVDVERLNAFCDEQEFDPSFPGFVRYCESGGIPCTVLSDGMDYYILRILSRAGLPDLPVRSNILRFGEPGLPAGQAGASSVRFIPEFPYSDEVCTRCASCKRNHMLGVSAEEDIIVYIGEGYSDRCPSRYADVIFAKDDLLNYCRTANIPFTAWRTFSDVQERLAAMIAKGPAGDAGLPAGHSGRRLHKRHQAVLARRDLYLGG